MVVDTKTKANMLIDDLNKTTAFIQCYQNVQETLSTFGESDWQVNEKLRNLHNDMKYYRSELLELVDGGLE